MGRSQDVVVELVTALLEDEEGSASRLVAAEAEEVVDLLRLLSGSSSLELVNSRSAEGTIGAVSSSSCPGFKSKL
jgi:hypothetical protein